MESLIARMRKLEGMISLLWVLLFGICFSWPPVVDRLQFKPVWLFIMTAIVLWWGGGLLFAVSAVRRGSVLNICCGWMTITGFILFLLHMSNVHRFHIF